MEIEGMKIILIVLIIAIIIAMIIFIFSGIFIVKEDNICVFEKFYKFYKVKTKGIYFFTPFLTKRVGKYSTKNQYIKFNLKHTQLYLIYKISDAKTYHYCNHNEFKDDLYNQLLISENNTNGFNELIKTVCIKYGLEVISIKTQTN